MVLVKEVDRIQGNIRVKPIRILHLIDSLGVGGTESQLALNVGALDSQRFENHVCYLHGPTDLEHLFTKNNVKTYHLGVSGRKQWVSGVSKLRRLAKSLDIDLIHTQLFEADMVGGIAGRLMGIPVVSTLANSVYEPEWVIDNPHLNRVKIASSKMLRYMVANLLNRHLIAVSGSVKSSAMRQLKLSDDKLTVVYRSLYPSWYEEVSDIEMQSVRKELTLNGSSPVILNTGRLIPQKGQRYAIEAMPYVLEKFPKARLLIAGEGFLRDSLQETIDRLGLSDNVTLLGKRRDVRTLLKVADIFAFPSLFEGCPNALIEAMSMGVPCVASAIEPNREVSREGKLALMTAQRDPQKMAEGIMALASNPEYAHSLSENAREVARQQFSISAAAERLEALFEQCVNRANPDVKAGN